MLEIDRFDTLFGTMFHLADDQTIGRSLRHYGQWALDEIALISLFMECDGGGFIDVGANVGTHTVAVSSLYPQASVYSVEPYSPAYRLLCANIIVNGRNHVRSFNILASESTGVAHAVTQLADQRNLGSASFRILPERGDQTSPLLLAPVDDLLERDDRISVIKINMAERSHEALLGLRQTIARYSPILYIDNKSYETKGPLQEHLSLLGYETFWHLDFLFDSANHKGESHNIFAGAVEASTLCVHPSHPLIKDIRRECPTIHVELNDAEWQRIVRFNGLLRTQLHSDLARSNEAAWLRNRLLDVMRGVSVITSNSEGESRPERSMPSFAEIRRATLVDVPGDLLPPLLAPYISRIPFDEASYLDRNPDVAQAVANGSFPSGYEHFLIAGYFEGRWP